MHYSYLETTCCIKMAVSCGGLVNSVLRNSHQTALARFNALIWLQFSDEQRLSPEKYDIINYIKRISDHLEPTANLQVQILKQDNFKPSNSLAHSRKVWFQSADIILCNTYKVLILAMGDLEVMSEKSRLLGPKH